MSLRERCSHEKDNIVSVGVDAWLDGGDWIKPHIPAKTREKKRRFGGGGTARTQGKRSRSLKMRANRRKAKAKVK